ncbi:MAG: hypothetical protein HQL69_01895 [Magnetococcales bacterium]|nr:hypothetical protein [Magnetococcales bacterium]
MKLLSLESLASLWVTVFALLAFGLGTVLVLKMGFTPTEVLALPFAILCINLLAAIIHTPSFRGEWALMVFHIALLVIILLTGLSRMTYLKGRFELAAGEQFTGRLLYRENGPWHDISVLEQLPFKHISIEVKYKADGKRGKTNNVVLWQADSNEKYKAVIGDGKPLYLKGYRILPTRHFGFSPLFGWQPADGSPLSLGTVNLPSLRLGSGLSTNWKIPGTTLDILTMLELKTPIPNPEQKSVFSTPVEHKLRVSLLGKSYVMKPGDRLNTPEGLLIYEKLGTWVGYTIFYDITIPWLLASCVIAVFALMVHFLTKYKHNPWDKE